jgi:Ser/Thr protein kinase RdoA (MazF antagonist)
MPAPNPDFASVLTGYSGDCRPSRVEAVASGGFSGSKIWRLETARGPLCLKRWPAEHPDAERLRSIHRVLAAVHAIGFQRIPLAIPNLRGETFVELDDHRWELTPWLPGEADQPQQLSQPSPPVRIDAALTALAEFHVAAGRGDKLQSTAAAPGLLSRTEQLKNLLAGEIDRLCREIEQNKACWPELAERSKPLVADFRRVAPNVHGSLADLTNLQVPIQPCIRDVHRDHVLFVGDQVTGIVDFGSMKSDSVACDVARLLGSMAIDDRALWDRGLAAYEQIRPLADAERSLIAAYDQTAVLLSGIHWLQWVFAEGRQFDCRDAVLRRFDLISLRLSRLSLPASGG